MHKKTNLPNKKTEMPDAAIPVWAHYQAMIGTKNNHLDYLRYLEEKYKNYGQPNNQEASHLASLLEKHDHQVTQFKTALQKLKQTDHNGHQKFIAYLAAKADIPKSTEK